MKLSEIKILKEEPVQTRTAEDLWGENSSTSAQYITTTVYYVRPIAGKRDMFEVLYDQAGKRKTYGTMTNDDLNAAFAPMRPNQRPDAEGFMTYRSADVYEAFKYNGDPVKVTLGANPAVGSAPDGQTVKLGKGDYLLRQDTGDEFVYTVEKSNYFDNAFKKKI